MKSADFRSLSVDQLWDLHEQVAAELNRKIQAEKGKLEERLRQLSSVRPPASDQIKSAKRSYPKVYPKYRNPKNHSETWAGRGKQPRWLVEQIRSGRKLEDFLIKGAKGGQSP